VFGASHFADAQRVWGNQSYLFFGRQPSTSVEAMGKANVSNFGDHGSAVFNPALLSGIHGISLQGSHNSPFYEVPKANFGFLALAGRINDKLKIGLSQHRYTFKHQPSIEALWGVSSTSRRSNLIIASEPLKTWHVGLTVTYHEFWFDHNLEDEASDLISESMLFDLGLAKQFFWQRDFDSVFVTIASSLMNFTANSTKSPIEEVKAEQLPITLRVGASSKHVIKNRLGSQRLNILETTVQVEYQNVLNSDYYGALRAGVEPSLFELVALRCGYYSQQEYDYGYPQSNVSELLAFTYGVGLRVPMNKLLDVPLILEMDYAHLPQVPYTKRPIDYPEFNSYSLKVNYLIGRN
jgi:hypothetical protein